MYFPPKNNSFKTFLHNPFFEVCKFVGSIIVGTALNLINLEAYL